jgi:hypothetical protein
MRRTLAGGTRRPTLVALALTAALGLAACVPPPGQSGGVRHAARQAPSSQSTGNPALEKARIAGYFVYDGHGEADGSKVFGNLNIETVERVQNAANTLGLRWQRVDSANNPRIQVWGVDVQINNVPDYVKTGSDAEVAQFFAAMIECEGGRNDGLVLDTGTPELRDSTVALLGRLGVHARVDSSGGKIRVFAPVEEWPIVQSWPYAQRNRVPGG